MTQRAALLVASLLIAGQGLAADWPQWRGPTGQGLSNEKDLPLTWGGKDNANILWKVELPKSQNPFSSPIVWRSNVFVASALDKPLEHRVLCFRADGRKLWDTPVEPGPWRLTDLRGGYNAPTPAADGERVYAVFGSAVVAALDYGGKLLWRKELKRLDFDVAMGMSPILYKDTVLLLCEQNKKNSSLIAFDRETGDIRWEANRPDVIFAHTTPLLTTVAGKPMLLIGASNALQGVDPEDGKVLWWCANEGDVPTPVYSGGIAYCDSGRGAAGIAVDPTGTGDVAKTHLKWKTERLPEAFGSALVVGDYLYRLLNTQQLRCFKLATGELVYSEKLPNVSAWASPIATADGRIYCASGGKSYVIRAGPKFEILGTGDLGDPDAASPAVADGRLFLRGRKFLFCIGQKP